MAKSLFFAISVFSLALTLSSHALAAEKLRVATPLKKSPEFVLVMLAGEERGFWKEQRLEVEWVPFKGGAPMGRALAAGSINAAWTVTPSAIFRISKGVPMLIAASLGGLPEMRIWVRSDSPIQAAKDLKGAKVALTRLGGLAYVTGLALSKLLNLEINFIAAGGVSEQVAAVKAGKAEGLMQAIPSMAPLKIRGQIRDVLATSDYLPKEWSEFVFVVRKDVLEKKPNEVKRLVSALLKSANFVEENPRWSIEKMKALLGYSGKTAKWIHKETLKFSDDGKIDRMGLEKVRSILIEHGLIPKEKAVPVDLLYTREVIGIR